MCFPLLTMLHRYARDSSSQLALFWFIIWLYSLFVTWVVIQYDNLINNVMDVSNNLKFVSDNLDCSHNHLLLFLTLHCIIHLVSFINTIYLLSWLQAWNHEFFWGCMKPGGGGKPSGELLQLIERDFGSFEKFVEEFKSAAATQFGSGWAWLVCE